MDRQQTEQIYNSANMGFHDMQRLLALQGLYFEEDPNSKSQAIISSGTASCPAGGKWRLNANWQLADYQDNGCRAPQLGLAGEEMFCKRSVVDTGAAVAYVDVPLNELGRNTGMNIAEGNYMNIQDYLSLASSKSIDVLTSRNGASLSNEISGLLHQQYGGRQSSVSDVQLLNDAWCRNPNVPLAAHQHWEHGNSKDGLNYIENVMLGCSSNPLTLPTMYQTGLDLTRSNYQRLEGVTLNHQRNINIDATHADKQMRQSSKYASIDHCSYSRSEYSSMGVLRTSKYLRAAQQLLEEVCNIKRLARYDKSAVKTAQHGRTNQAAAAAAAAAPHHSLQCDDPIRDIRAAAPNIMISRTCKKQMYALDDQGRIKDGEERFRLQMKKAQLISMVEELDRGYQQYHEQMQLIITSLESATGMNAAAPYTSLPKKLISRQFRALRDAIEAQIRSACRMLGEDISTVPILNKGETPRLRILDQRLRHHRTLQQVGMLPQVWRPQRGLPENSVAVLRAWLFEHFLHPYPKDSEKLMLARLTGLTRSQVANWFINARVRLWKPLVEQMYMEENKEAESQNQAGVECQKEHESGCAFKNNEDMALATCENPPKRHHYEHFVHEEGNSTASQAALMTKHGVSLTLALQHSSTDELASNTYKSNQHYILHPVPGVPDYNIADVFS